MTTNLAWFLGLLAFVGTACASQVASFPEPWRPWIAIGGVIGTAVSGYMMQRPRREWTEYERAVKTAAKE